VSSQTTSRHICVIDRAVIAPSRGAPSLVPDFAAPVLPWLTPWQHTAYGRHPRARATLEPYAVAATYAAPPRSLSSPLHLPGTIEESFRPSSRGQLRVATTTSREKSYGTTGSVESGTRRPLPRSGPGSLVHRRGRRGLREGHHYRARWAPDRDPGPRPATATFRVSGWCGPSRKLGRHAHSADRSPVPSR
jgi:hypothetical protein